MPPEVIDSAEQLREETRLCPELSHFPERLMRGFKFAP